MQCVCLVNNTKRKETYMHQKSQVFIDVISPRKKKNNLLKFIMDSPGWEPELMTIRLEGKDLYPARILGGNIDAFSSPKFVLVKTR